MKRKRYIIVALMASPILFLLFAYSFYFFLNPPHFTKNLGQNVIITVNIPENASSREVGKILHEKGLIRSSLVFSLYTRLKEVDKQLKAGEYSLQPFLSVPEIILQLIKGQPDIIKITIPEGYTIQQIAGLLAEKGVIHQESFLQDVEQGCFNYPFPADLPAVPRRMEGYLFPDTYYLSKNISEHEIIELMLKRFFQEIESLNYVQQARQIGLTLHEALIIASLVEKEAKVDEERPVIAGVILNRLRMGMPLQVDATVQYALGNYRPKLYYKDLEVDSPYNTYKITGLPPSPIASPGSASLLAVVKPENNDYLYYVAKPDGTHAFARTLDEHNANKLEFQP